MAAPMGSSALLGKSFYTSSLLPKFEPSRMSLKNALKSAENERSTIRGSWAEYLTDLESENCSKPSKIWSYV